MSAAAPEAIRTGARGEAWTRLASETVLARRALAVIGLHVVDDRFLQPEPGRAASDHLVSGFVPLVMISAAAIVYPRLRPGLRASLALLFGYFGVLAGTEAAYYAANGGPSGDDYTGLLSLVAGLLLLGIGSATLWTSRRQSHNRAWRYGRRLLIAVGVVLAAGVVFLPTSVAYVVTHTARAEVPRAEFGNAFEDVQFRTSDGLLLKGWYIPSQNGAAVIAFPGRPGPQKQARMLARHGYGVLLFDRRGEGESEGDPNAFGWGGERDLYAAAAVPAALLAHDVVQPARNGLECLLCEREALRRHRTSSKQVPEHVERDPPLGIAERLLLLAGQADVGDSAAAHVGEHVVHAGRTTHLGAALGWGRNNGYNLGRGGRTPG
jgi:hypothetical protein